MREKKFLKYLLIALSVFFLSVMLVFPLIFVVSSALSEGVVVYFEAIRSSQTLQAISLTLLTVVLTVIVNIVFSLFAIWLFFHFQFKGKNILMSLVDLPFAISPVVVGVIYVLTFGRTGWLFPLLDFLGIKIIFATPAIVLVTIFVTFPFIAREVLPVLQTRGNEEEQVAAMFGESAWKIFKNITFPYIRWPFLYGFVLTSARALGEYGAVSMVSGNLRGKTVTVPLQVEMLYNEYQFATSYAVASVLVIFAIILLLVRNRMERRVNQNVR